MSLRSEPLVGPRSFVVVTVEGKPLSRLILSVQPSVSFFFRTAFHRSNPTKLRIEEDHLFVGRRTPRVYPPKSVGLSPTPGNLNNLTTVVLSASML
jgi:hypothetical protein